MFVFIVSTYTECCTNSIITSHWQISLAPGKPSCSPCHKQPVCPDTSVVSSSLHATVWSYLGFGPAVQTPPLTDLNGLVWRTVGQNSPLAGQSCSHCRAAVAFRWHVSQKHSWLDISDLSCTSLFPWRQTRYFQPRVRRLQSQKSAGKRSDRSKAPVLSGCIVVFFSIDYLPQMY